MPSAQKLLNAAFSQMKMNRELTSFRTHSEDVRDAPVQDAHQHIARLKKLLDTSMFEGLLEAEEFIGKEYSVILEYSDLREAADQHKISNEEHLAAFDELYSSRSLFGVGIPREIRDKILDTNIAQDIGRLSSTEKKILSEKFEGSENVTIKMIQQAAVEEIKRTGVQVFSETSIELLMMLNTPIKPRPLPQKPLLDMVVAKYPKDDIPKQATNLTELFEASRGPILLLQILQGKFDVENGGEFDLEASTEALKNKINHMETEYVENGKQYVANQIEQIDIRDAF
ncbi:hypothetical protein OA90_26230 [Labrenzia sp. OB1]|nr:hypothetical protein OA90_26230 [Labrenzia sp. OB1]